MEIIDEPIPGIKLLKPRVFEDNRGHFFESYNRKAFRESGITDDFVQDNQSLSHKGVLRGLHFQKGAHAQSKLIRVVRGKVQDVVVDIRKDSPHYKKWYSVILDDQDHLQLYVPAGFAHGFATLENNTLFSYKCSEYYHPESEAGIRYNDPELNIKWELSDPDLSPKDQQLPFLNHRK